MMKSKILNIANRYDTPEEEAAYQRGYSEGFQDAHTASMKVIYILLAKRKDMSVDVMDSELKSVPPDVKLSAELITGGKRWRIV